MQGIYKAVGTALIELEEQAYTVIEDSEELTAEEVFYFVQQVVTGVKGEAKVVRREQNITVYFV